jgi:hypothetical protein
LLFNLPQSVIFKNLSAMMIIGFLSYLFIASHKRTSLTHSTHSTQSSLSLSTPRSTIPTVPFSDLDFNLEPSVLQDYLRNDILRRGNELIALGWLGRGYVAAPIIFNNFFRLQSYSNDTAICQSLPGGGMMIECTLKESSIIARGKN